MSYSAEVKNELLSLGQPEGCCAQAFLSAIIHTAGSISISKNGLYAEIATQNEKLAKAASAAAEKLFGLKCEILAEKKNSLKKNTLYTLITPKQGSEVMLSELAIIGYDENNRRRIIHGVDKSLAEQDCCAASYLRGAFLSCGSVTIPGRYKSGGIGYHLEFVLTNELMANDILSLLERLNLYGKLSVRKDDYVVYIKESEAISDLLVLIGAEKAALAVQTVKVEREVKNNTNRQTNCILANIDKAVEAAVKQTEAINLIEEKMGLSALPEKLRSVARLRQEYPDVSLESIAALSEEKLTKSGINHRMRKIMEIAAELESP